MSIFGKRLKAVRTAAEFSQEQLGIEAGLDPMSASARMNRYELGKRVPDFDLVEHIGKVLNVPAAYFYAKSDDEAELLVRFHRMPKAQQTKVVAFVEGLS
jgi:transcriptional regulator with XRE-family HTH domain